MQQYIHRPQQHQRQQCPGSQDDTSTVRRRKPQEQRTAGDGMEDSSEFMAVPAKDPESLSIPDSEPHKDPLVSPVGSTRSLSRSPRRSPEPSLPLPPPCTCPYFGEGQEGKAIERSSDIIIVPSSEVTLGALGAGLPLGTEGGLPSSLRQHLSKSCDIPKVPSKGSNMVVTWEPPPAGSLRSPFNGAGPSGLGASSGGGVRTSLVASSSSAESSPSHRGVPSHRLPLLRRAATLRYPSPSIFTKEDSQGLTLR